MSSEHQCVKILMFPWLAQGHIFPLVGLAKRLIQRNFHVYLCSTPVNLEPFRQSNDSYPLLEFVDFHLSTTELPEVYHTTRNLPTHLIPALRNAFDASRENFRSILKTIKPDILIYDFVQPWAPQVASEEGVSSTAFVVVSGTSTSLLAHEVVRPETDFPFESFRFSEAERKFCDVLNFVADDEGKDRFLGSFQRSSASFVLINSSNMVEAKCIGYLSELLKKEIVPIGFLVQDPVLGSDDATLLNWLNKKNPESVVFVSYGSEYFLSKKEMHEVALGLENSGVSFVWSVRFPAGAKMDLDEALPQGFRARVGDRGMTLEGWAPQVMILNHLSVGGFLTHCGWNSILETMSFGVPVISMPMKLERPMNSRLLVELGIGVEIRRDGEEFRSGEIAKAIKKVMVEEEGKVIRRNADRLRSEIRGKRGVEMDVVVERLEQLARA